MSCRIAELLICLSIALLCSAGINNDEQKSRPYRFGFTLEGNQHRRESRDELGIVMGEFGFVTGDGIYHITTYATDENGKFKIVSMKNIPITSISELDIGVNSPLRVALKMIPLKPTISQPQKAHLPQTSYTTTTDASIPSNIKTCSNCKIPKVPLPKETTPLGPEVKTKVTYPTDENLEAALIEPEIDVRFNGDTPMNENINKKLSSHPLSSKNVNEVIVNTATPVNIIQNELTSHIPLMQQKKQLSINMDSISSTIYKPNAVMTVHSSVPHEFNGMRAEGDVFIAPQTTLSHNLNMDLHEANLQTMYNDKISEDTVSLPPLQKNHLHDTMNEHMSVESEPAIPNLSKQFIIIMDEHIKFVPSFDSVPYKLIQAKQSENSAFENGQVINNTNSTSTGHGSIDSPETNVSHDFDGIRTEADAFIAPKTTLSIDLNGDLNEENVNTIHTDKLSETIPSLPLFEKNYLHEINNEPTKPNSQKQFIIVMDEHIKFVPSFDSVPYKLTQTTGSENSAVENGQDKNNEISTSTEKLLADSPETTLSEHNNMEDINTNVDNQSSFVSSPSQANQPIDSVGDEYHMAVDPPMLTLVSPLPNSVLTNPLESPQREQNELTINNKLLIDTKSIEYTTTEGYYSTSSLNELPIYEEEKERETLQEISAITTPNNLEDYNTPTFSTPKYSETLHEIQPLSYPNAINNDNTAVPERPSISLPLPLRYNSEAHLDVPQSIINYAVPRNHHPESVKTANGLLYRFNYAANYNGHEEQGDIEGNKDGSYYFVGRDGFKRTITYTANENGFRPKILWQRVDANEVPRPELETHQTLQDYNFKWFN